VGALSSKGFLCHLHPAMAALYVDNHSKEV